MKTSAVDRTRNRIRRFREDERATLGVPWAMLLLFLWITIQIVFRFP